MTNFIHLPINSREFGRWCGLRGLQDQDSALHALVTGLVGRQVLQPFRYFEGPESGSIYAYTEQSAEDLNALIQITATPDVERVLGGPIAAKALPKLAAGARIGFEIRMVTVRRRDGRERDAYDADLAFGNHISREESYLKWFAERLGQAAGIEEFRLAKTHRFRSLRKDRRVEVPEAVFQGTLNIQDAALFETILAKGIGRQRSYGYGMLLLRPADPVRM